MTQTPTGSNSSLPELFQHFEQELLQAADPTRRLISMAGKLGLKKGARSPLDTFSNDKLSSPA